MKGLAGLLDSRRAFLTLLGGYFLIHLLLRLSLPDSLDLDESEQLFQSQWWLLGYGPQPPLYNWLQQIFLWVFGNSVFALALLKNLLLLGTWSLVYLIAQRCLGSNRLAALATLSLVFLPQISWESQRDLSHSVLVTTLAAATILQGLRLLDRPSLGNYLLLGLVVGLGCNAKYSYLLFVSALMLAALSLTEVRRQLLQPSLALTALVALAVALPHWWWLLGNLDLAADSTLAKLMRPTARGWVMPRFGGLLSLLNASLQFLALFALLFAGFWVRRDGYQPRTNLTARLLRRYLWVLAGLFVLLILITGIDFIKDRWLQPLLLLVPVAALSLIQTERRSGLGYARTALVLLVLIPVLLGLRVLAVDISGRPERLNLPYGPLMERMSQDPTPALVLTDRVRTAGNLRLQLPATPVLAAERLDLGDWTAGEGGEVWMIWDATGLSELPAALVPALNQLRPAMRVEQLRYIELPLHYSERQNATFGFARLVADPS